MNRKGKKEFREDGKAKEETSMPLRLEFSL